jgi:hypothetical protein
LDRNTTSQEGLKFVIHHDAFHVSDEGFDTILKPVQELGLSFGSDPWNLEILELMTRTLVWRRKEDRS